MLGGIVLASLAVSCTTPDIAPVAEIAAPSATQTDTSSTEVSGAEAPPNAEVVQPKAPPPKPPQPAAAEQPVPAPLDSTPWGSALRTTGKSRGLRFTTTAQVERTASGLQLAIEVELHNSTRAPMKISLHPPLVLVSTAPAPGSTGEGLGLGMRGEGMGSDVCSPGHGGPATLPAGGRAFVKRTVELDPLPWPMGQAYRVTATSRDCRPGRLSLEVLDVIVVQPASPDGVPSVVAAATVDAPRLPSTGHVEAVGEHTGRTGEAFTGRSAHR
jgi:hypothetical protein